MVFIFVFIICFSASLIGAICGIGGGIIIKPALDAFGIMSVSAISFLSGCTVLSMTTYSVAKSVRSGTSRVEMKTGLPLALGAAVGGVIGKTLFQTLKNMSANPDRVGAVQAVCLLLVTFGTLLYTVNKKRIVTRKVESRLVCLVIGLLLGVMSSFLGIGGGPMNLVVLFYFFSMDTKTAAENSLYIIWLSQFAGIAVSVFTKTVPEFSFALLILMICGGLAGGAVGRKVNKKIEDVTVDRLFVGLMAVIIMICGYNIYQFI